MPRVNHVKKARKDNPVAKKGEPYYWWKFRYGGKHYSTTPPKPSQLTQSAFLSTIYDYQESCESIPGDALDVAEAIDLLRDLADNVRDLGSEQEDKLSNMPYSLQDSETGELLRSRSEECQQIADEIEAAVSELENIRDEAAMSDEKIIVCDTIQDAIDGISWDVS